jgi:ABC-type multidrug transport system fused ATPase/permease subunit
MYPRRSQETVTRHEIPIIGRFLHYFTITRAFIGIELALLVFLNLVSAIIESIGVLLFIPFLSQLTTSTAPPDRIQRLLAAFFASWNITVTIGYTLALLVFVFVLKGVTVFFLTAYRQKLLNRTGQKIREALIALYSDVDYRYALRKTGGFFSNLVVSETERACMAMEGFCNVLSTLITACIFFTIAFFLHSSLSVFMLVAVGFLAILLRKLSARARRYSVQITRLATRLNEFLVQTSQAFKYLKATMRFSPLQSQLSKICADSAQMRNKLAMVNAALIAVQEPVLVICLACIFYYAVVIGQSHIASVMVSVLFFYRCMIEMGHFNRHWQWVSSYAGGLELVWTAAKEMEQHRERQGGEAVDRFHEKIELRNVSYVYDAQVVLQDVNIRIGKNTSVALVGASGAGKTTLVDLLTGVLKPTPGTVWVDDMDLHTLNLSRYRQSIGYVEQETVVFDDTIANNISMQWNQSVDAPTRARIEQAAHNSYCEDFIERLPERYNTRVGERGLKLSGGQRQRLAIARELFKQPDILILDEATSSLDSQSESYIQQSIERLRGALTIIIISHRLSTIKHVDYVYVIEQGRIIEQGTFAELSGLQGSAFRRMCELQRVESS